MAAFVPTSRSGRRIPQILAAELSRADESVPMILRRALRLSLASSAGGSLSAFTSTLQRGLSAICPGRRLDF